MKWNRPKPLHSHISDNGEVSTQLFNIAFRYSHSPYGNEPILISASENPIPPMVTASLIFAQYARPWRTLPMVFVLPLAGSSYMNVSGYETSAAGTNAAWSGLFLILARRGNSFYNFMKIWTPRGAIRGTTIGLCAVNAVSGGYVWATDRIGENNE